MLFAGWEVRIVRTVTEVLKMLPVAAGPWQHFTSRQRSQFFTIQTDPKPVNNLLIFFLP